METTFLEAEMSTTSRVKAVVSAGIIRELRDAEADMPKFPACFESEMHIGKYS